MPRNNLYDRHVKQPDFIQSMDPFMLAFNGQYLVTRQEGLVAEKLKEQFPSLSEEASRMKTVASHAETARQSNMAYWLSLRDDELLNARALLVPRKGTSDSTSLLRVELPGSDTVGVAERLDRLGVVRTRSDTNDDMDTEPKKSKKTHEDKTEPMYNNFLRRDVDLSKPSDILGIGIHEYLPVTEPSLDVPRASSQLDAVIGLVDAPRRSRVKRGNSSATSSDVDDLSSGLDRMTLGSNNQESYPHQSHMSDKNIDKGNNPEVKSDPTRSSSNVNVPVNHPSVNKKKTFSIFLPLLSAEYKRQKVTYDWTGPNQARLYLVAEVKFLGALGIFDCPVFGLVTEGAVGVVICAWMLKGNSLSKGLHDIYIFERNARSYDISQPLGALSFAAFLLWLRFDHAERLKEKFTSQLRSELIQKLETDHDDLKWKLSDQFAKEDSDRAEAKARERVKKKQEKDKKTEKKPRETLFPKMTPSSVRAPNEKGAGQ
ncbi:hypothetical protein OF83DRAFT_889612 [Amylostereum chailletii]|nr:hypothetical protein OF83DRAFT_889612 [Amylostereum chailletii]